MADFLDATLTTIQELRHAETPGTFIKQRMAANAEQISNAARIQGAVEVANEALFRLTSILYQTIDKQPVNIDSATYRLLVPCPWGDAGYHKWGMRAVEARILRAVLMTRAVSDSQAALFDYGDRRWFLNVAAYRNQSAAMEYLKAKPITAKEWLRAANAWHEREKRRGNTQGTRK